MGKTQSTVRTRYLSLSLLINMAFCCGNKNVSKPEAKAQTAPESKVVEPTSSVEPHVPMQEPAPEPAETQATEEPTKFSASNMIKNEETKVEEDKVQKGVTDETRTFEEWVANGKKIPEGMVFI